MFRAKEPKMGMLRLIFNNLVPGLLYFLYVLDQAFNFNA